MSWSYVSVFEMIDVLKANILSTLFIILTVYAVNPFNLFPNGYPRSVVLLDFIISNIIIALTRLSKRLFLFFQNNRLTNGKKTLIVGAGNAGEMILRDMRRQPDNLYRPICFVDDNPGKRNKLLQGIKILGSSDKIPELVEKYNIETFFIAIPSASSDELRRIMSFIRQTEVKDIRIIPGIKKILEGKVVINDLKQIKIEDILGREQINAESTDIYRFLNNRRILITGAGGSIGSEIVRQCLEYNPSQLIALDIDETELFYLQQEIGEKNRAIDFIPIVADITDTNKIKYIFKQWMPEIIMHAAAYKHVPMMEMYPEEAVRVNILGTMNLAVASLEFDVKKFIMISTDKAVTPTSVMGSTKRVAEEICRALNNDKDGQQTKDIVASDLSDTTHEKTNESSELSIINHELEPDINRQKTKFISVRFGNVVGSRGSVIPIFENQIRKGGPVKVTHSEMKRFFMSIPEAVTLVLHASAMGKGGEIFILDMGEPVKILNIAQDMIRLHGLEPDKDIPIIFTGIRRGEKLYEELTTPHESIEKTDHPKIMKVKNNDLKEDLFKKIELLKKAARTHDKKKIIAILKDIIPAYSPDINE